MSISVAGAIPEFSLSDRLRKAREHSGLDQTQLAEAMGVSRGTVSNAERGQHAVRPIVIKMWAMSTGVSLQWLETGTAPDPEGPGAEGVHRPRFELGTHWLTHSRSQNVIPLPRNSAPDTIAA